MADEPISASEAYQNTVTGNAFTELCTSFVCPYPDCRVYAQHHWSKPESGHTRVGNTLHHARTLHAVDIRTAYCAHCNRDAVWVGGRMVQPMANDAPIRSSDMPADIIAEYDEAALIVNTSPRGAAALLRLSVQKLLPLLGATKRDINDQIGELVGNGMLSRRVSDALDTLRVIGNEAVHPGTIDLTDDRETAIGLFRLINYIVEKAISEPKHADQLFALIPQPKRDGIEQRNARVVARGDPAAE